VESSHESMDEFRKQLKRGYIQKAYKELMEFIMDLKTHFKDKYPGYSVSGSLYNGYMDMTYFAFSPQSLRQHNLKVAIVFNYDLFRFEVWLAGKNRQIQQQYWTRFKESGWNKYHIVATTKGVDSIVEHTLADDPDFDDQNSLTKQIETETMSFIRHIEDFLGKQQSKYAGH
jgi:hypothetical protein